MSDEMLELKGNSFTSLEEEVKQIELQKEEQALEKPALEPEPVELTSFDLIAQLNGPSKGQIEDLKKQLQTDLFAVHISEDEVYLIRPLKRGEWLQLKDLFARGGESLTEDKKQEEIVSRCLVWPKFGLTELISTKAGLIDTLSEAIMFRSCFFDARIISAITEKL